jgi:formylglycine-generating enzyme required for sulfatase activity
MILLVPNAGITQEIHPPYYAVSGMSIEAATATQLAAAQHFGLPLHRVLEVGHGVSIETVLLPPGEFLMGGLLSPDETASNFGGPPGVFELEHPQHPVRLTRPFYVGRNEVTKRQWHAVLGGPRPSEREAEFPAEGVTWDDIQEFVLALSGIVDETVYLISEAEWEYACRAGSSSEFSHGSSLVPGLSNVDTDQAEPVGTFPQSAWGLHDMHGNLVEWVQDGYGAYPDSSQTDPKGPDHIGRMLRGGGYDRSAWHARCSYRYAHLPSRGDQGAGFRIAFIPQRLKDPG